MINTIGYILICFIPLIAAFICFKLLVSDFKWTYGFRACLLGLLSVVPIETVLFLLGYLNMSYTSLQLSVSTIIIYGLVEEVFKMLMMFLFPSKKINLKTFIIYGALVGLSFACFEDFVYLVSGFTNLSARLLTAGVIHITATALSAIFVYSIKNKNIAVLPFVFAVLMHGLYNFFSIMPYPYYLFAIAVIAFGIIECRTRYVAYKNKVNESIASKGAKAYQDTKVESKKDTTTTLKTEGVSDVKEESVTKIAEPTESTVNKEAESEAKLESEVNSEPEEVKVDDEKTLNDNVSDEELSTLIVDPEESETAISEEEVSAIEQDIKETPSEEKAEEAETEERDETLFKIQFSGVSPSNAEEGTVVKTIVKATRKTRVTKAKAEDKTDSEPKSKTATKATAKKTTAAAEKKAKSSTTTKTAAKKTTSATKSTAKTTKAIAESKTKATAAKKTTAKTTATATKAKTTKASAATKSKTATKAKATATKKTATAKATSATKASGTKSTTAKKTASATKTAAKTTTKKTTAKAKSTKTTK